jgi:HlyD family secretion protein
VTKTTVLILVLLLAAAGAALAFLWPFPNGNVLQLPGIVEIQEVRLGSKIGGRVARVMAAEGQIVSRGQELVAFEAPELENQRKQLLAQLDAAKAERDRIMNGARPEEKRAAVAAAAAAEARFRKLDAGWREEEKRWVASELEAAEAEMKQALDDSVRLGDLYRTRSASRAEYDAALAARDRARGHLNAARAKHEMYTKGSRPEEKAEAYEEWQRILAKAEELTSGSREEDKRLAQAKVAQTEAKLQEVDINLKETVVHVPDAAQFSKAIVEVLAVRPGDVVPAGQPVVRMLSADDLWVKIFVPETKLGLITLGKQVDVTIDSYPGKMFKGVVIQRSSISEFTPRNVQSVDERRHQVFGVKIRVDDPQGVFSAGMAANVTIPLE